MGAEAVGLAMEMTHSASAENRTVSESVVEAVAREKDVEPSELSDRLYEAIDPEALDRVFAGTATTDRGNGTVVFTYHGCEVTVHGDGSVSAES